MKQAISLSQALTIAHRYQYLEQFQSAEQIYRQILQTAPNVIEALNGLGDVLIDQGKLEEAETYCRQAVTLNPDFVDGYKNLGDTLKLQGYFEQAKICYQRALTLEPHNDALKIKLATILPVIADSSTMLLQCRQQFEENVNRLLSETLSVKEPNRTVGITNFYLAYQGLADRTLQMQLATLFQRACPDLLYTAPHCQTSYTIKNRKITIGFISRFFRHHTIGKVMSGIIAQLDRTQFKVSVFFLPQIADEFSKFIQTRVDYFEVLSPVLAVAQQQLAKQQLDILFYPDIGMEAFTYFLAFARLAPIQCTTWGHPMTTGIPNMDYFISSQLQEVIGAETHYSEKLVRLSRIPTFYYKPALPPLTKQRSDFGLRDSVHLYVCVQSLFKIHPDFDVIFAQILQRDPQGQVILVEGTYRAWTQRLKQRFAQTVPAVQERICFLPRMSLLDYFNLIALADVLLDTFPFGGGGTSYEALAVGTPIVTLPTRFMRGRATYACYQRMGIADCIAQDIDHYVEIALHLGKDRFYREQIKALLLANHDSLYADRNIVRELEQFFYDIVGDGEREPAQ